MAMEQPSVAESMNSTTTSKINANRQKLASIIKPLYFVATRILLRRNIKSQVQTKILVMLKACWISVLTVEIKFHKIILKMHHEMQFTHLIQYKRIL